MVLVRTRRRQRLVIKHRRFVSTDNNSCCDGGGRRGPEKVIIPVRIPPNLFVSKKNRRLCRRPRFAPYPKSSRSKTMFKQGYSSDGMINNQASTSIPPPPPATALNMQFNGQPSFSAFTPDYYQQFPYTFSSATPPMYSWANTNSTDIMKYIYSIAIVSNIIASNGNMILISGSRDQVIHYHWTHRHTIPITLDQSRNEK